MKQVIFVIVIFGLLGLLGLVVTNRPVELEIEIQKNWISKLDVSVCEQLDIEIWDSGLKEELIRRFDKVNRENIEDFYRYFYEEEKDGSIILMYGILIKNYSDLKYNEKMFQFIKQYIINFFKKRVNRSE